MVNISRFAIKQIVKPSLKFNFDLFHFHCDYITKNYKEYYKIITISLIFIKIINLCQNANYLDGGKTEKPNGMN